MASGDRRLSHIDIDGAAAMVDVSEKTTTARSALASGEFVTTPEVIGLLATDGLPKSDALATARVGGIMGAKRTSELIPLCHQIALTSVTIDFQLRDESVLIRAVAKTTDRTGVEMEALTAVTVAGLVLHDMVKAVDPSATMTNIRLDEKLGGKSQSWTR